MSDLRHFLDIDRLDKATIRSILDQAAWFKSSKAGTGEPLKGKSIVLIFEKPSTRKMAPVQNPLEFPLFLHVFLDCFLTFTCTYSVRTDSGLRY